LRKKDRTEAGAANLLNALFLSYAHWYGQMDARPNPDLRTKYRTAAAAAHLLKAYTPPCGLPTAINTGC